ncbi:MAG: thioredoxin [Candidatus Altiarchaeota archaeon]|nr:thioredoxin [Candidatus Altiarchaeota archaeon]
MTEIDEIRERRMDELKRGLEHPKEPIEVTDTNLGEILGKYPLVAVDCWAAWCMPCKIIEPVIEELSREYSGKVVFGKLDVDENRETAMKFGISSIPSLLVFKEGEMVDRIVGAVPKEHIVERLKKVGDGIQQL